MKNISLTFQVHQPVRLRRYRFFDIGNDNYYYDDYDNERRIRNSADECYLPNNHILLKLLTKNKGRFKVAFSISGTAIDLFTLYAPEVIKSFQQLAATGRVEFLAETYSHSLSSLKNMDEFIRQAEIHAKKIAELFGKRPLVFKNTELIYSDRIGKLAAEVGFNSVLAESCGHTPGWRSPNHLYINPDNQEIKILFKNSHLSEEAGYCLSNPDRTVKPTLAKDFQTLLNTLPEDDNTVNLCIDYEIVRSDKARGSGKACIAESFLTEITRLSEYCLKFPSEIANDHQPVSEISVPENIVRADEFASLSKLQGNELQLEALDKLYELKNRINPNTNRDLWKDWQYLQSSDHFYYMSSRFFSNSDAHHHLNPYNNPYEAFINYMNVLSDFKIRLNNLPAREIGFDPLSQRRIGELANVS
jgi:alpha-amylase